MSAFTVPSDEPEVDFRDPVLRLSQLLDPGTLVALDTADDSGVRTARGTIGRAQVIAYCTDATTMGGALGSSGADRIIDAVDLAVAEGLPVVGIWHSGGAKLADGVESMDGVGRMFAAMTRASGKVPQISVVLGPAAGAAAYGPAITDVVVLSEAGRMFITGPDVVRSVTGEQIDMAGLGGPEAHGKRSGVAHVLASSEPEAYLKARRLVGYFATPGMFDLGMLSRPGADLRALLPESPRRAYDVLPLVESIMDEGSFEQLQAKFAPNVMTGLGRLGRRSVGLVATNPLRKGGCLDSNSAEKAARFVRLCDAFGIPLLVLVDVPGYLPGVEQEWGGVVRRGAKLLHAFAESVVPRVTVITRKSYGGAYIAMNSRSLGATKVFAWPGAEVAVMGAEAAVAILYRKRLAACASDEEREEMRAQLIDEHRRVAGGVERALALGVVDEVIASADTRRAVGMALAAAPARRGDHGNIPL